MRTYTCTFVSIILRNSSPCYCTHVLERVDALGGLLDFTSNHLGDELLGELVQGAAGSLPLHDLYHLLPDRTDLRRRSVCSLLDLVGSALGEGDGEEAEEVVVGGLDDHVGFNESLPLAHERAKLVGCEVETVEVGEAVLALYLVDAELDLAERMVLILLEIGERNLDYASLQRVVGVLETGGAVDEGLADTASSLSVLFVGVQVLGIVLSDGERRGSLDGVPVLLGEGIGLLLETLLSLRETLVLSYGHDCDGYVWCRRRVLSIGEYPVVVVEVLEPQNWCVARTLAYGLASGKLVEVSSRETPFNGNRRVHNTTRPLFFHVLHVILIQSICVKKV